MTMRAVLYARVSGDDRGRDGRNLAGQLDMCREHALRQGWRIVAELAEDDRGASGASFELPQLNRVREMATDGKFDILVVREIDRLSRNLAKQLIVEEELRRTGVQIEYALAEYPDSPEGRLNKHIRATIAEYEREKINERMTRGRRQKVRAGNVVMHGHTPYGYRQEQVNGKTMLVIHEPEAQVIRSIFSWYVEGDKSGKPLSINTIARQLKGTPTKQDIEGRSRKESEYGTWSPATVGAILKSETYAGVWHYGKCYESADNPTTEVEVPALVSREMWHAAQTRRAKHNNEARGNRRYDYLLSGRVTCGRCGGKMFGHSHPDQKSGKLYSYYNCRTLRNPDRYPGRTCDGMRFRVDHVDDVVWDWIRSLLTEPESLLEGLVAQQEKQEALNAPLRERLQIVDELLDEQRRQLERLLDLYLADDFSREVLIDRKQRLENTIEALEKERNNLRLHLEARILTAEQVRTIQEFAEKLGKGLTLADAEENFQSRRRIIEELNVQAILAMEDGERVVHASCILEEGKVFTLTSTNSGTRWPARRRAGSGLSRSRRSRSCRRPAARPAR
jgi:site-specific DNA recombinase